MRTMFSTIAALALGLIAAVAMGQEGAPGPSPSALQSGAQQPTSPAPQVVPQPAPPPVEADAPVLGADGVQPALTQPTDVEKRLDNRAELQREIDRTEALNDRQDGILENRDLGRDAAANRANRSFNDYRENPDTDDLSTQRRPSDDNRWRYVRHNNQWWYWTPQSTWLIWSGDRWMAQADFNRMYTSRPYQGSYRTGYRGDRYYDDGFYDRGYYGSGRGYYGRGNYGRGYNGSGYYGPGYYGPGYYNRGAATGAGIGGAIGGRGGANVGAAIGGTINGW